MAKARASSSAKSDTKKPAAKGSAASSKKKADEPKSAAPAKGGPKKTAAVPAKPAAKAGTPSQGTKATQAAGGGDKGKHLEAKPAKTEAATRAEPAKPSSAPEPQPSAKTAEPTKQTATAPAAPSAQPKTEVAPPQAATREAEVGAEKPPEQSEAAAAPETPLPPTEPKPEYEPIGPNALDGFELPSVYGKAGVFGGPKDHSAKADDKLALPTGLHFQYERYRSLNPKSFYCAMRWDYRQQHKSTEEGKRWWANKKLLVANPSNGKSVVVRAMDYGPHESTGFAIAVSPGAAEALGINPGDEVLVAFADPKAPTGAVG
jgi:hypothetical protein